MWLDRSLEGYASTFWTSLRGLTKKDINLSKEIGIFSFENENTAGQNVINRKD